MACHRILLELTTNLEPIFHWHQDITQDQIRHHLDRFINSRLSIHTTGDLVKVTKTYLQVFQHIGIIFYDEDIRLVIDVLDCACARMTFHMRARINRSGTIYK